jgi:hypothetical protein
MRQTREPREWRRDGSPIRKVRDQSIVAYAYALGQCSPEFSVFHSQSRMRSISFRAEAAAVLQAYWFQNFDALVGQAVSPVLFASPEHTVK